MPARSKSERRYDSKNCPRASRKTRGRTTTGPGSDCAANSKGIKLSRRGEPRRARAPPTGRGASAASRGLAGDLAKIVAVRALAMELRLLEQPRSVDEPA